ncbi:MAG: ATP-binding protein [Candidatus Gastranaerophilales bacterium]|nr:ATP-binding protein [Candidatus Gastranaerophilales bacterium]
MNQNQNQQNMFSTPNKVIVFGWFLSSLLIFTTAWLVINNTQQKIFDSYYNFGLMLTKSLTVESIDLISDMTEEQKLQRLELHADLMTQTNNDIAYITFKDSAGNILYTNKGKKKYEKIKPLSISMPMKADIDGKSIVIGSVELGLTGNNMSIIGKTTRNSMIIIFTIAWIIAIFAVVVNTLLITRQITILSDGVKRISSGEFGYKLKSKDLWGEIKQLFEAFNDMSVRLRQYEEKNIDQLTYERNRLEAVLMGIANGVIACDNYDKVLLINNSALKMLDIESKTILKSKIHEYCDTNEEKCFKNHIEKFKDTPLEEIEKKPFEFSCEIDHKIIKGLISPMFSSITQEYQGYIMILHDATKEAEIDKLKDTFISNVSHELRTPVTVLRSYIDTLHNYNKEFDEETKEEFIGIMNQEVDRLNKMVNDILDFSRLESPEVSLQKSLADIEPIIDLTVKSMNVLAEEKHILISIIIEPNLPKVYINAEGIERVIKNLLSNALKYSNENGRIKIRAEIDKTGNYIEVSVEDNGIGIPEKYLHKIYDRFYRVENNTHAIKGTGLGLHIVKTAIEKHHNGEVFVKSKENEGSKFGFRLPIINTFSQENENHDNEWEITFTKKEKV